MLEVAVFLSRCGLGAMGPFRTWLVEWRKEVGPGCRPHRLAVAASGPARITGTAVPGRSRLPSPR